MYYVWYPKRFMKYKRISITDIIRVPSSNGLGHMQAIIAGSQMAWLCASNI